MPGSSKKPRKKSQVNQNLESNTKTTEEVEISSEEQERRNLEQQMLNNARFMSIVFADGALRFRQAFLDNEIEANNKATNDINKELNKNKPNGWESMAKRNLIQNNVFKAKQEKINEVLEQVVNDHTKYLDDAGKKEFGNIVVGLKIVFEEYMNAKDPAAFVTLIKMYNNGLLDGIFEKLKPKNDENNNQNPNPNDIANDVVQENNTTAAVRPNSYGDERAGNDGHEQSGPVPNGDV